MVIARPSRWTLLAAMLSLCLVLPAYGSDKKNPVPDVPLEQWLHGPDRADFPVAIKVLRPRLTYQQRYLVEVRAVIDGPVANKRHLFAWLMVADPFGKWDDLSMRNDDIVGMTLDPTMEVQFISAFYATPATYTAAFAVYDAVSKHLYVRHFAVAVEPLKNDPMPAFGAGAPRVEFIEQIPSLAQSFDSLGSAPLQKVDAYWPLADGIMPLGVATARPLQFDVVIDFSDIGDRVKFAGPLPFRKRSQMLYIETATAMADALTGLHPEKGCLRLSAFDADSMEVDMWRQAPDQLDWNAIRKQRLKRYTQVSVAGLQGRKDRPAFIRNLLQRLATPEAGCGSENPSALHVVILVSQGFQFDDGSHKQALDPRELGEYKLFYFRVEPSHQVESGFGRRSLAVMEPMFDQLTGILKPIHPRLTNIPSPEKFREALGKTLAEIAATK